MHPDHLSAFPHNVNELFLDMTAGEHQGNVQNFHPLLQFIHNICKIACIWNIKEQILQFIGERPFSSYNLSDSLPSAALCDTPNRCLPSLQTTSALWHQVH